MLKILSIYEVHPFLFYDKVFSCVLVHAVILLEFLLAIVPSDWPGEQVVLYDIGYFLTESTFFNGVVTYGICWTTFFIVVSLQGGSIGSRSKLSV